MPSQLPQALKEFEKTIAEFPNCAEGYALYGQVRELMDLKICCCC